MCKIEYVLLSPLYQSSYQSDVVGDANAYIHSLGRHWTFILHMMQRDSLTVVQNDVKLSI